MFAAFACSSTRVGITPAAPARKLCQNVGENIHALVLWRPQWRPDQKEPIKREEAAKLGIKDFFSTSRCFGKTRIERSDAENIAAYQQTNVKSSPDFERLIHITLRELGPVVRLFNSFALLEGGTEVVLEIEVSDTRADLVEKYRLHWQDGGPWTLKGATTLPADMTAALAAVFN
ncbi:MAG: hypothetical protein ACOY5B_15135 [Spirochaetota bacterium]